MFKLVQLYSLVMCLIASVIIMITVALMLGCITDITLVEYKEYNYLNNFKNNEKYIEYKIQSSVDIKNLDSETITSNRLLEKNNYIEDKKGSAISSFIPLFTWFFTGFIFFIVHWRLYKRSTV